MEDTNKPQLFQIFVKLLDGKTATLRFTTPHVNTQSIKQRIFEITKIPTETQRLISNGTQLRETSVISTPECTVHLLLRLIGGKGGFGSLLRGSANKAGQKKTNNFDACRDMSGRRLRHVNAEKRLEEWKAEENERRLEKIAEEFIKKNLKKGKEKGGKDGESDKYVAKYREDSAKCAKQVEDAVREACANGMGNGKRKGKVAVDLDPKRLKIWMGKRKLGGSDSEEDSSDDDDGEEKSVVVNNANKEADASSDSVTGGWQQDCSGGASCESGSEEKKDDVTVTGDAGAVESEVHEQVVPQSDAVKAEKHENVGLDSQPMRVSSPVRVEVIESVPNTLESETVADIKETGLGKPLNFDDFGSAVEMEALGMERLKNELQAHGLKCGGTLQERAARLFLLKTTPLDKLPKKLLAKEIKSSVSIFSG